MLPLSTPVVIDHNLAVPTEGSGSEPVIGRHLLSLATDGGWVVCNDESHDPRGTCLRVSRQMSRVAVSQQQMSNLFDMTRASLCVSMTSSRKRLTFFVYMAFVSEWFELLLWLRTLLGGINGPMSLKLTAATSGSKWLRRIQRTSHAAIQLTH